MNFDQFSFDPRIAARIRAVGYTTPTTIQQQAIPKVLAGRDVMGIAQTGTGKTAAFMLPILQRLTTGPLRRVRVLIVTPTRELSEQIHDMTRDFSQNSKVRSVSVYGGVSKPSQVSRLRNGAEIVIACPGRLLDISGDGDIDLSRVEVLVLDEADRMIDMGFLPDIRRILKLLPARRQNLFFAATMPEDIRKLAGQILQDAVTVQIGEIAPAKTVSHALYPVPANLKKSLLLAMLEQMSTGRVLIFTRTKHRARNLARDLEKGGHRAAALQGNMSQNARQRSIDGFRKGKYDILAATDVASRGIDVPKISHVINFDIPNTVDDYIHRIGRTGRARRTGEAFTLAAQADEKMVREIEKQLGTRIERRRLPGFNYGEFVPEIPFPESQSKPQSSTVSNRKRRQPRRHGRNNNHHRSKRGR
ncbi:MAG: DEAD/DEAH box helicase [Chloroflexi bacterium]|nr:DEAD/DEAH box helicase [Chloroflexota bacterium]